MATVPRLGTPHISIEVVEWLERLFPDRSPQLKDPPREVWHKAGQASVAQKVRHAFEMQQKSNEVLVK